MEPQETSQGSGGKLKRFINQCRIVLRVTKKPNKDEFTTIVKVAGLGILAIGLLGFLFAMIRSFF